MKRIFCLLLSLILCVPFVGCSKNSGTRKNTLMIYMIGSDLEAKGGAGTNDLDELMQSGIDIKNTNVIIYAGGSKRWHNEYFSSEAENTVLKLNEKGYEKIKTESAVSMGDAKSLSNFLNYSYKNYPAENYSLILWNHGNGPLIGYGKDMLFENDSLTLEEMNTALNDSPFGKDKKLDWIGFDACLMSSAELICVLDDYANYLVASQEVEPAFGWNYNVFGNLSKKDTKTFLTTLTEQYLKSCEDYYIEREYEPQDTTLALIDLSKSKELEISIENLFKKAINDVDKNYNTLTTSRINTRALGRATTGSEYDLIDLYDLAEQLNGIYTNESNDIKKIIDDMVISNSTNAEKCCGISIYYPFYNKTYYEKSWCEAYEKIGVLKEYATYLKKYDDIWLKNDMLLSVTKSVVPQTKTATQYSLELSEEQSKTFANASYYILQREGDQIYTRIFSSKKVKKEQNTLIADFDGQIMYAKNKFDEYWIPVTVEHDTVGNQTRYSAYVNLTNDTGSWSDRPDDYAHKVLGHRFYLTANNDTKKIGKSALVPYDIDVDTGTLISGKQEDADLSEWTTYYFLNERHKYLKRNENGIIKAFNEWDKSEYLSGNTSKVGDEVEFLFAPIPDGEYYLMFEVEDTQGNKFCSELLPIKSSGNELKKEFYQDTIEINWTSGDKIKLFEKENVAVYIKLHAKEDILGNLQETQYFLEVENKNNFDIVVSGDYLMYNNEVFCSNGSIGYFVTKAKSTTTAEYGFSFGDAQDLDVIDKLNSLQMAISAETNKGDKTIIYKQEVSINLSEKTSLIPKNNTSFYKYDQPSRDILAKEQIIFEKDGIKGSLVGLGGEGDNSNIIAGFCFENTSSEVRYIYIDGFCFDDVYLETGSGSICVYPNTKVYYRAYLSENELDESMINSPSSMSVLVRFTKFATLEGGGGFSEIIWCPIDLASKGSGVNFKPGDTVLYNKNGIKIALKEARQPQYDGGVVSWIMTVENNSGKDISIKTENITVNGKKLTDDLSIGTGAFAGVDDCANGKKAIFEMNYYPENNKKIKLTFVPVIYDIVEEGLLFKGDETIELNIKIK